MYAEKEKIRHCFNRSAHRYDEASKVQRYVADALFQLLTEVEITPQNILDLGSGTGYCLGPLQQNFPHAERIGIDFAYAMCFQAAEKKMGDLICADFDALPFTENCFDLVFSNLALQWSLNLSATLAELSRVLAPQGYVAFSSLGAGSLAELERAWQHIDTDKHINSFLSLSQIETYVQESGFELIQAHHESKSFSYTSALDVMLSLKGVGANHVLNKPAQGLNYKRLLSILEQVYPRDLVQQKCLLTYEIVYVIARKKP